METAICASTVIEIYEVKELNNEKENINVNQYQFEPIKGYPMLNWKGKRPYTSTQYYPAQLKETYGKSNSDWVNKIFWGDNLQVMSHLLKEYRGKIDLIYIDPPFDSRADYKKTISLKGKAINSDYNSFEEKQYTDMWSHDEYLQFMYERIMIIKELLSDTGTFFLHCDWNKGHYLKLICDEIFGQDNFKNQIVWKRSTPRGNSSTRLPEITDYILFYTKSNSYRWNNLYTEYRQEYIDKYYNHICELTGRKFQPTSLLGHAGVNPVREWKGIFKPWRYAVENLDKLDAEGKIYWPEKGGIPRLKRYLDEQKGLPLQSLWEDIPPVNSQAEEDTKYPTQKPEKLLERILDLTTKPGDLVFDCFMGSGTLQSVAMKKERKFLGADINLGAIQTVTKRLSEILKEHPEYTGFEIYNVNNYDIFKNPVEAKELIIEALEINRLTNNDIFDGEKDGQMIKVISPNRIATKADLNEIIANLDYKAYEEKQKNNPNQVVEIIKLVCMGHEPDLAAYLKKEIPYKIDIEVVDILKDKSNLEFKRDSEALIVIEKDKLLIENFYPMNLLQKLSILKENVSDWKELVESIMIDWNYDGVILEPSIIDLPLKNEVVTGVYTVPDDAGTIRVKITDLLSESLEVSIENE